MDGVMLSVRNIRAGYGTRAVLRGVDLDARRGELVAVIGPNGCGKTTLLRAITGVLPFDGEIAVDGASVRGASAAELARKVAVVTQGAALPAGFRAFDVAMMGRTPHLRLLQSEGRRDIELVRAAMERADCWDLRDRLVEELSGGERQRVVIARALAQEPRVLLLDEATAHLDLKHQLAVLELVQSLAHEHGLAVLATLHDLNQAGLYADRVALLAGGELRAVGLPAEVLTPAHLSAAYGLPVSVIPHPTYGTPLVLPDGRS